MNQLLIYALAAKAIAVPTEDTLPHWRNLPTSTVQALALGGGFLWVGTEEGLVRFDGLSFAEVRGLSARKPHVTCISPDLTEGVWVGTLGQGLWLVRRGQGRQIPGGPPRILSVAPVSEGRVWVGTGEGELLLLHPGDRWERVWRWGPGEAILALIALDGSGVWVGTRSQGLWYCQRDQVAYCQAIAGLPPGPVVALAPRDRANLLVAIRHRGLWVLPRRGGMPAGAFGEAMLSKVISMVAAPDGTLWVGTDGEGVCHLDAQGRVLHRFLGGETVFALAAGPEGAWAGLLAHGLVRLGAGVAAKLRGSPEGLVFSVCQTPDGCVWFGAERGQLTRICGDAVQHWELPRPEQSRVLSVVPADASAVWVGSGGHGVWLVQPSQPAERLSESWALPSPHVRSLLAKHDLLLVGTEAGLVEVAEPRGTQPRSRLLLPGVAVTSLAEDEKGRVFVGTRNRGLAVWESGQVHWIGEGTALAGSSVSDVLVAKDQAVWITTAGEGLFAWREGQLQQWSIAQGLPTSRLGALLGDRNGRLWIGTNRGLLAVDPRTLKPNRAPSYRVGLADGLLAEETVCLSHPAAWPAADETLLFATVSGVFAVRPRALETVANLPLEVVLEGAEADGEYHEFTGKRLVLPPSPKRVQFSLAVSGLLASPRLALSYRLRPGEETWNPLAPGDSPTYTFLRPGRYVLEVRAEAWPESSPAEEKWLVQVQTHWWQNPWFLVAAVLLVAGVLGVVFYIRWRWLAFTRRVQEERVALAERLHHDLAQVLTAAKLQLETPQPQTAQARELIGQALEQIRETVLFPLAARSFRSFPGPLRQWFSRALAGTGMSVNIREVGERGKLLPEEEEAVFRLAQEAITNALRHGGARRVELLVRWEKDAVLLSVRDDGCGFSEKSRLGGGISSTWRAVSETAGTMRLATGEDGGTELEIRIPRRK